MVGVLLSANYGQQPRIHSHPGLDDILQKCHLADADIDVLSLCW